MGGEGKEIEAARELIKAQRPDGGWGQLNALPSDAYATGTGSVALHEAAGLAAHDPVYQRGLTYLLKAELPDDTWHLRRRCRDSWPWVNTCRTLSCWQFRSEPERAAATFSPPRVPIRTVP